MNAEMKRRKTEMNAMCVECGQSLSETILNDLDLSSANNELTTLTTPQLLSVYDSEGVDSTDTFPTHRLTEYAIYDRNNHLVSVDSGLIEEGKEIYVSGFVKCIYDDDESTETGIETKDIGPINEWWIGGFDGGDSLLIGLESCSASYVLMKPSFSYLPFFSKIVDKLYLCKYTIEFLTKNIDASYEELVDYIWNRSQEKYNEDLVLSNASFLIEQIMSYDEAAEEDDPIILESRCVQDMLEFFVDRAQVQNCRRSALKMKHIARKDARKLSNSDTYATSTTLVREFFEEMFKEAIDNSSEKRNDKSLKKVSNKQKRQTKKLNSNIHWHRQATHKDIYSRITYYSSVKISDIEFNSTDFVETCVNFGIGRVAFFLETQNKEKFAHIHWFCHGSETVLKGTCDHHQIFMRYDCENVSLDKIIRKVTIRLDYNSASSDAEVDNDDCDFICNKVYMNETGHFENLPQIDTDTNVTKTIHCVSCDFKEKHEKQTTKLGDQIGITCNTLQYKNVCIKNEWYSLKDCVLLAPETFECFNVFKMHDQVSPENDFDETIFTERYRKSFSDFITGSLTDAPSPTQIGQIKSIFVASDSQEVNFEIIKFYRPENVFKTFEEAFHRNLNEIFSTNETTTIKFTSVVGKCKIFYCEKAPKMKNNFPDWFYFSQLYDVNNETFRTPFQDEIETFDTVIDNDVSNAIKKLRTLDLFAGCGGLALGFENSGVSDTRWAVEKDSCAAASFRKNFQKATVFEEDANLLLKQIISGAKFSESGQFLPKQGEVDLILAGPPCQGFSGINRFSSRQYSLFKNSLIITLLSYIDFFRPSYVVIENVRNFVLFKNSMIIKLTLSCLLKMNYQIRFGVIQAGAFGVPQSRRRAFIFAAAGDVKLPNFPKPTHVFSQRACQLSVFIDGIRYSPTVDYKIALFRAITVRDAISDLPKIDTDSPKKVSYKSAPLCQYQRIMRLNCKETIRDHCCKQISALTKARIHEIPQTAGSDWRDLPNIRVPLPDGTVVNKLLYLYHDVKNGKTQNGKLRGVCNCASGNECDVGKSRQENTLIPWCLVHTANRQYQWSGLYGRLQFDGFFPTIVTNPEPIGKQGRVIHPEENRIISVRECARSQTFPDNFSFIGGIPDRHRQIGNAVPPLLAYSIGLQFRAAIEMAT